jgi:bifunctional non-homologous end joining protein LigD
VKEFAYTFVLALEKSKPSLYLTKMTKSARAGKIYLDYLRNERGATAVAAFSPRARPGAPVSLPLRWSDLKLPERPLFHVADFPAWKSRLKSDPWKHLPETHQTLRP